MTSTTSILDYFPYDKPRPSQLKVLLWVEKNWDRFDLMVLQCPVAAGKSGLAVTIANWANQEHGVLTGITTPDNVLVNQYKQDFNLLTLPYRNSFASGDLYVQAKNEFKAAPLKVMNNFTLLANRAYSDLQIMDECFPGDVEVLTNFGFKRFDELGTHEKVAQVDSNSLELDFVMPSRYVKKQVVDHDMVRFSSTKNINLTCTAKHAMLVTNRLNGITSKYYADAVPLSTSQVYRAGISTQFGPETMSSWQKLMIATQADGCITGKSNIQFSFSKQRKIDKFKELMAEGKFEYSEVKGKPVNGACQAKRRFIVRRMQGASKVLWDHFEIQDISANLGREILEYMVEWDGCRINKNQLYFSSVIKTNADFYQTVACLSGYSSNMTVQVDPRKDTFSDVHRLFISKDRSSVGLSTSKRTSHKYSGNVFCVTVPKGNIIVRQKGKPIVVGNCHQLIPMLQDFEGIKIWQHLEGYPKTIKTVADLLVWAGSRGPKDKLGKKITKLVSRNPSDYVVVQDSELYRGRIRDYLRIYPLTPKNNKPILWPPSKVKKLILMSATIAKPDIEDLGLHNRRVGYIEVPSDIPPANRPFIFVGQGSMGRGNARETLPKIMTKLRDIHNGNGGRGMLHTTYSLSSSMQAKGETPALIFHGITDKRDKLNAWMYDQSDKRTFVGCGLTTGLNLKYTVCNWQAIMKCQFPDLADPAVAAKAERSPEWYAWTTIKQIVQAYGRVCRAPDDLGATYMLDSDFIRLYTEYKHLWPTWFTEALEIR
jgi:hypothetical protein